MQRQRNNTESCNLLNLSFPMILPAGWRKGRLWADAADSRRSYMLEHSGGLAKEAAL